jgi:hypothetical protein
VCCVRLSEAERGIQAEGSGAGKAWQSASVGTCLGAPVRTRTMHRLAGFGPCCSEQPVLAPLVLHVSPVLHPPPHTLPAPLGINHCRA